MTPYVLLDTNILIRFVTQGQPGCEPEQFDAVKEFVQSGKVKLFSSEVVNWSSLSNPRSSEELHNAF